MNDSLVSLVVVVGILLGSALITNWFARHMYKRCAICGTLNAKRRTHCRECGAEIE